MSMLAMVFGSILRPDRLPKLLPLGTGESVDRAGIALTVVLSVVAVLVGALLWRVAPTALWGAVLVAAEIAFALMVVVCSVRGISDVRDLLRVLTSDDQ
jgi:FtsH-binding integral membrane protein